jgi:hypothetical protein
MKNQYEIRGDIAVIFVNHKGEKLECLIDADELELVSSVKGTWSFSKGYVLYRIQKKNESRQINLHRLLMNPEAGKVVDHINHNTLDNRKTNLRVLAQAENMQNMNANKGSASGIRGVHKYRDKWAARLGTKQLGVFADKFEAEKVVIAARAKYMPYSLEALAE